MSIIERENPLNLQYRIAVVTNASSPLGVVICKTLLKANANVLGVDMHDRHHTLNAGLGTHFQFERLDVHAGDTPQKIVQAAQEKYGLERLDILVNIVEEGKEGDLDGLKRLSEVIGQVMAKEKTGAIITVHDNVEAKREQLNSLGDLTRSLAQDHQKNGIRCNAILPEGQGADDDSSKKSYENAKQHMKEIIKGEKSANNKPAEPKFYEVGNLALFLAGDLGDKVEGSWVHLDGSAQKL